MKHAMGKENLIGSTISEAHMEFVGKGAFGSLFVWASSLAEGLHMERSRC